MDRLSNELGRLQAEVPLASHYTILRNPFSCHCAFPWPGLSVRKQAQPLLGIRHLQGRLGLAHSPGFRAPSPPRRCGNISQSRYLRSEQTGCEEILALDAWQERGPWLPGAWGRTAPSHRLEPTDTSNRSLLPSGLRLRRKCSWITFTRGRGGAAGNTWISMVLFFPKLQKTSPSLISHDLPQQQGKKRKISQFRWGNEGVGGRERKQMACSHGAGQGCDSGGRGCRLQTS